MNFKVLHNNLSEKEKKDFKFVCIKEKINKNKKILEKYINDPEISNLINDKFKPTNTALDVLKFLTKNEENNLTIKEQSKEIHNFFKFTALVLNQKLAENMENENLIKSFFILNIPSDKTLSKNIIYLNLEEYLIELLKNIYLIDDKRFDLVFTFFKENPDVVNSNNLVKINRVCSYMSFLVKQIFEYYSAKAADGFYLYKLRNLLHENKKLIEILERENIN